MENFWRLVHQYRIDHPNQREGQVLFNCFSIMHPNISNFVCGKPFDPFYDDERIPQFVRFVESILSK